MPAFAIPRANTIHRAPGDRPPRRCNETTGSAGATTQTLDCSFYQGYLGLPSAYHYLHDWTADVPVVPGLNEVVISARRTYLLDTPSRLRVTVTRY